MAWLRIASLAIVAVVLSSCFAPELVPCAFRCGAGEACPSGLECLSDGFCHDELDLPNCAVRGDGSVAFIDARVPDGPIVDSGPADAGPPDAPLSDGGPADARSLDARPDASIFQPDAGPPDARPDARPVDAFGPTPDATPDCVEVCSDPRACDIVDGCDCGAICFDDDWCGANCVFAVCEEGNCCLPEGATCDVGLGQCCVGLTCVVFCVFL